MPSQREDLWATEESIKRDAEQLIAIEAEKGGLDPANGRVMRLSEQAERLAISLATKTKAERELSEDLAKSK